MSVLTDLAVELQAEIAVTGKVILVVHVRTGSPFLVRKSMKSKISKGKLDVKMLSMVTQIPVTSN